MSANQYYSGGGGDHPQQPYGGQGYGQPPQQVRDIPYPKSHARALQVSQEPG